MSNEEIVRKFELELRPTAEAFARAATAQLALAIMAADPDVRSALVKQLGILVGTIFSSEMEKLDPIKRKHQQPTPAAERRVQ